MTNRSSIEKNINDVSNSIFKYTGIIKHINNNSLLIGSEQVSFSLPNLEKVIGESIISLEDGTRIKFVGNLDETLIGEKIKIEKIKIDIGTTNQYNKINITNEISNQTISYIWGNKKESKLKGTNTYLTLDPNIFDESICFQTDIEILMKKMFDSY